jgi:anti-sigma-K factor RskA
VNRPDDHVAFEELAAGYALSALEPAEEYLFLAHLATCTRCRRDVADHEATLATLALTAQPAEPPPSVLEGIRAGLPTRGPSPVPASAPPTSLTDVRARRERRSSPATRFAGAAAAAAVVLALGTWNVTLRAGQQDAREHRDRLVVAVRELASPGSRDVALVEEDGSVVAVAVIRDREVSVVVDGLAPNDESTTYVLWAQDRTGAVSAVGAFDVDEREVDVVSGLGVDADLRAVTALLVSKEQGDEAPPQPLGQVLASGEV